MPVCRLYCVLYFLFTNAFFKLPAAGFFFQIMELVYHRFYWRVVKIVKICFKILPKNVSRSIYSIVKRVFKTCRDTRTNLMWAALEGGSLRKR